MEVIPLTLRRIPGLIEPIGIKSLLRTYRGNTHHRDTLLSGGGEEGY